MSEDTKNARNAAIVEHEKYIEKFAEAVAAHERAKAHLDNLEGSLRLAKSEVARTLDRITIARADMTQKEQAKWEAIRASRDAVDADVQAAKEKARQKT